jgi:hypothetical protein
MSRSYKKPIVKDKKPKRWYKVVRNTNNQIVKSKITKFIPSIYALEEAGLWEFIDEFRGEPLPINTIVNPYDICDWIWHVNPKDIESVAYAKRK